jgi:hypothetical protein
MMFLTPNDLIDLLCDMLNSPASASDRSSKKAISILRSFDWNESAFVLLRDNAVLRSSAQAVVEWISADSQRDELFFSQRSNLERVRDETSPEDNTFSAAHASNRKLRGALSEFIESCTKTASCSHLSGFDGLVSKIAASLAQEATLDRPRARR